MFRDILNFLVQSTNINNYQSRVLAKHQIEVIIHRSKQLHRKNKVIINVERFDEKIENYTLTNETNEVNVDAANNLLNDLLQYF